MQQSVIKLSLYYCPLFRKGDPNYDIGHGPQPLKYLGDVMESTEYFPGIKSSKTDAKPLITVLALENL